MAPKTQDANVDAVLEALGNIRLYSISQYILNLVAVWTMPMVMFSVVFTGQQNAFRCAKTSQSNTSISLESSLHGLSTDGNKYIFGENISSLEINFGGVCSVPIGSQNDILNFTEDGMENTSLSCTAFSVEYERPDDIYFVSDFNLVCEREFMIGLSQTLLTLGNLVAAIIFPYFTDRFGRRIVSLTCSFLSIFANIGISTSVNYGMFAFFKFVIGFSIQGLQCAIVTMMIENLATKYRSKMFGAMGSINWCVGMFILTLFAYLLRDYSWRVLEYTITASFVYIVFHLMFLTETIRWLAANNRIDRLHATLTRAAKWNSVDPKFIICMLYSTQTTEYQRASEDGKHTDLVLHRSSNYDEESLQRISTRKSALLNDNVSDTTENLQFWHLFNDPILRVHTLFSFFSWLFNSLTYFSLILMTSTLHGSLYVNFTLNTLAEIPQGILIFFFLDKLGRRVSFSLFSVVAGITLITLAVVRTMAPQQFVTITMLSILGKTAVTGSFNVMYTLSPELFPTSVRNMGLGISYLGGRIGGMLAPFADMLMKKAVYAPGLIFGISSLILSMMIFFLPETTGVQIPQTLEEIKRWKKTGFYFPGIRRGVDHKDNNTTV